MPWWGWVLVGIAVVAILVPIKIKVGKRFLASRNPKKEESEEDF